jgi:hypothetical protein
VELMASEGLERSSIEVAPSSIVTWVDERPALPGHLPTRVKGHQVEVYAYGLPTTPFDTRAGNTPRTSQVRTWVWEAERQGELRKPTVRVAAPAATDEEQD